MINSNFFFFFKSVAMNSPDVDSLLEEKDRAQEKLIKSIIAEVIYLCSFALRCIIIF